MSRLTRIEKLHRLNRFREDQATGVVHEAHGKQREAADAHDEALASVNAIGDWKSGATKSRALDVAVYAAALELEGRAMEQAGELERALVEARAHSARAAAALVAATTRVRVSETREERERGLAEVVEEKRIFDQTSDLWLNNREARR